MSLFCNKPGPWQDKFAARGRDCPANEHGLRLTWQRRLIFSIAVFAQIHLNSNSLWNRPGDSTQAPIRYPATGISA